MIHIRAIDLLESAFALLVIINKSNAHQTRNITKSHLVRVFKDSSTRTP